MKRLICIMLTATLCGACAKSGDRYLRTETMFVASEMRWAMGIERVRVLVVKSPGGEWDFLYNNIEGFEWEQGYEYELRVNVYELDNPPMDSSSLVYVLKREISKTRKDSTGLPDDVIPPQ